MKRPIYRRIGNKKECFHTAIIRILVCALVLFQFGCSRTQHMPGADYLLITDQELAAVNAKGSWELAGKRKRDSEDQNLSFSTDMFFEDDEFFFGKTNMSKNQRVYLERISKNPVEVLRKKIAYGDTQCMAYNGRELLTTVNRYSELLICKYDKDLNVMDEYSLEWIKQQDMEGYICWDIQPKEDGWIFLIVTHPAGTDAQYNENHLLFLDSEFQVQMDYDLGLYDGTYSSFALKDNDVYLSRYAQGETESYEPSYCSTIDVFSLENGMITASYELPYTTNGRFVQNASEEVLILDRSRAQTDRQVPIVILWPETGEAVPVRIDFEDPHTSDSVPFISIDQDKIYLTYRSAVYCFSLNDRTLERVGLDNLGLSDFVLFKRC